MKDKEKPSYLVYSRKFRPQGFEEVLGQEPIIRTLKNGISQDRIPQNFLFSGPRGVGKTSTARIVAKILNCEKASSGEPCDKCQSCREIIQGNSLDVLEIDGASNRGIDEIRNLRETVKFKPVAGRYKVYIIDEVHMLTTEAFNALLKTLEEPPPHIKFIFATTESHKVPLTILSRCQRFNFKRIPTSDIVKKLEGIVKQEKLKAEKNALFLIAKAADGALRDAESLLDQLVSFSDQKIEESDVLAMLGLASEEIYFETLRGIREKDAKKIFGLVKKLYEDGVDLNQYSKSLLEVFRHLLMLQYSDAMEEFIEMSDEGIKALKEFKAAFTKSELLLAVNFLNSLQGQYRRNLIPPRLLLETTLLKLMTMDQLKSVEKLLEAPSSAPGAQGFSRPASAAPRFEASQAPSAGWKPELQTSAPRVIPSASKPQGSGSSAATLIAPRAAAATASASFSLNQIETVWPQVIEYVKLKKMSNGIFLSEASPVEVAGSSVTLAFPPEFAFHKEMLEKDVNRRLVEEAFQVSLGARIGIQFVIAKPEQKDLSEEEMAPLPPTDGAKLPDIISEAMNIFDGAKIVRKDP